MTTSSSNVIRRLGRLPEYRVSPGEPDIRGWLVIGGDGRRVGRVHDILIDVNTLRTRHVEVKLDPRLSETVGGQTAVLPVECLQVAPVRPYLHLIGVSTAEFVDLPGYGTAPIGADEEAALRRFFRCDGRSQGPENFWQLRRGERASKPYISPAWGE